jgi:hypothetical protein
MSKLSTPTEPTERWLPVVGWENLYEVSSHGRVKSLDRVDRFGRLFKGRLLRLTPGSHSYPMAQLYRKGKRCGRTVHSLVLEAFVGPRPSGMEVCHLDGSRSNNRLGNLRWDTRKANHADKLGHDTHLRGERASNSKLTSQDVLSIRKDKRPQRIIAAQYGISRPTVSEIQNKRKWAWLAD